MPELSNKIRVWSRYLGFSLGEIMSAYDLSGINLIFRDTVFLKKVTKINQTFKYGIQGNEPNEFGKELGVKGLRFTSAVGDTIKFNDGFYNSANGYTEYIKKELLKVIDIMWHLHKAKSCESLYFLNIYYGLSHMFFVITSFRMILSSSYIFRKGMDFTLEGILPTLLLLKL